MPLAFSSIRFWQRVCVCAALGWQSLDLVELSLRQEVPLCLVYV